MRLFRLFLVLLSILIISCGPPKDPAYQKLYDEVMVIHDDVMPKMTDINRAKKKLRKLKDGTNDELITLQIEQLDAADEAMMSWMHEFDSPELPTLEENLEYLNAEKDKIQAVSDQMLQSLKEADLLIKTYPK
jgi:hypothetical protein